MAKGKRKSAVQREIQQTKPFRSLGQEALIALLRTSSVLQRQLARVIAPAGITLQQYNVLRILRGAGPEGLPTLDVRRRLIEEAAGITRLIDRLEKAGLVARVRGATDRRKVHVHVTAAGLALLARLERAVQAADEAALAMLSAAEQRELIRLLDAVRRAHAATARRAKGGEAPA